MSCTRTLTLSPQANDMPLDDAVVLGSSIYGTMGPYVMKFSAATGAFDSSARVVPTGIGPCRIAAHAGGIYISHHWNPATQQGAFDTTGRGIYSINPATLAVIAFRDTGTQWDRDGLTPGSFGIVEHRATGPYCMLSTGGYLWTMFKRGGTVDGYSLLAVDTSTNPFTIWQTSTAPTGFVPEQLATDGVGIIAPYFDRFRYRLVSNIDPSSGNFNSVDTGITSVSGVAMNNDVIWMVNGTATMLRYVWSTDAQATFNLATVQAGVAPYRIQYNPFNGLLYIPCQNQDCVIVWNPATDTGTLVSGLASPIDVVFTATKQWAVQNSSTPLVDIT